MRILHHYWLHCACRTVRLVMGEKKLDFQMILQPWWERPRRLLELNPAADVPVLEEVEQIVISGERAICEYLDERYPRAPMFGSNPVQRAEVRRLLDWFDRKFDSEVASYFVAEKGIKRLLGQGDPDSTALRIGSKNLRTHMSYLAWLLDRRDWLAGDQLTLADWAAAGRLSSIDYFGDVAWNDYPGIKAWYISVKSRPAFRPLLQEQIPRIMSAPHYAEIDF